MIKVWTDAAEAGLLDRHGERGSTFAYLPGAPPARAVSVTMPLRLPSWSVPFGLPPIFEMNLPEGVSARAAAPCFRESHRHLRRIRPAVDRRPLAGRPHPLYRRQGAAARGRAVPVGG